MPTPQPTRHTIDGIDHWLYQGRLYPVAAGADDTDDEAKAKADADAKAASDKEAADKAEADRKAEEAKLGEGGKAALDAERKAKKEAEKRAREAEKKLKDREEADLSETEKLKKQAEDGKKLADSATQKLQRANLLTALGEQGLTGSKAKAAAKLLEGVEYDDDDEPTNLEDRIKAATAEYGEDMFKGATPRKKPPATDGGEGGEEDGKGPSLTADELKAAKASGMTPEEYANYKSPRPKLPEKKTT